MGRLAANGRLCIGLESLWSSATGNTERKKEMEKDVYKHKGVALVCCITPLWGYVANTIRLGLSAFSFLNTRMGHRDGFGCGFAALGFSDIPRANIIGKRLSVEQYP